MQVSKTCKEYNIETTGNRMMNQVQLDYSIDEIG